LEIVRTFIYDCLVDNLHTSTPLDTSDIASHDDIFRLPRRPRVPRRWTPRFLLLPRSGRARATTAAVPMTLLRPASLLLPRQHSSCGDPAAARYSTLITSSIVMSSVT